MFKAELNEFLTRELAEDGYSGVEVRVTPQRTEIIIMATKTQNVLGEKGRRIRELTAVVQKRYATYRLLEMGRAFVTLSFNITDSTSLREVLNFTQKRWQPVDCALLPKPNHCVTN